MVADVVAVAVALVVVVAVVALVQPNQRLIDRTIATAATTTATAVKQQ